MPTVTHHFSIYIHWPYCLRKCPYCDFASQACSDPPHDRFWRACLADWENWRPRVGNRKLVSVYFGGGTPSLIRPGDIHTMLEGIDDHYRTEDAEITMEINPAEGNGERLKDFLDAGVNRLSVDVQSFDDGVLSFLGRRHDGRQAVRALQNAREVGFDNIGIDLILGSRPSVREQLASDLRTALDLKVDHVSAYLLTVEEETPFGRRASQGEALTLDDETCRDHYEFCRDTLRSAGFEHYEISNYARPGKRSVHNWLYWSGEMYAGIGPAAHGYDPIGTGHGPQRLINPQDSGTFMANVLEGQKTDRIVETLSAEMLVKDTLLTALRRRDGISEAEFLSRTGLRLGELFEKTVEKHLSTGWLEWVGGGGSRVLRLTDEGVFVSDGVFEDFFAAFP